MSFTPYPLTSQTTREVHTAYANAYKSFFKQDVIQLILNKHQLPLIVVDTQTEEIGQWIN
ncbi:hypothetical protein H6H01_15090 [Nostoc calcicola FACHB-3891]|nr:hypothetical protein [Nostoc calcicola FACHB-3891]